MKLAGEVAGFYSQARRIVQDFRTLNKGDPILNESEFRARLGCENIRYGSVCFRTHEGFGPTAYGRNPGSRLSRDLAEEPQFRSVGNTDKYASYQGLSSAGGFLVIGTKKTGNTACCSIFAPCFRNR